MAQRTDLTLGKKIKLLDDALQTPGISQQQRAELLSIPRTTLIRLTNEEEQLTLKWSHTKNHPKNS